MDGILVINWFRLQTVIIFISDFYLKKTYNLYKKLIINGINYAQIEKTNLHVHLLA